MRDELRSVPLFAELTDDDLLRLEERSERIGLAPGDKLFDEGAAGARAFVITSGEIEILKRNAGRDVQLAVRRPGEVIGEMALLRDAPRSATAVARTASEVIAIPKAEIDALMESSNQAVRALFKNLVDRWQATQALLAQSERMAQLGTLTAGLAHELNNPAAAVNRSAGQLRASIDELVDAERGLISVVSPEDRFRVDELRDRLVGKRGAPGQPLDPLTRSDLEGEVEDRLLGAGLTDGWRLAPGIVEAGLAGEMDDILGSVGEEQLPALLEALHAAHDVDSLIHEVEEGTRRLSAIVKALKSYSYLDQAPVQEVDLVAGLEDTLLILKSKLAGITVRREYADDLPRIQAYGSELNQVWTNLVDNAADAIHEAGRDDGEVVIRLRPAGDDVVVEVEDNGQGIAPETIHRVFDSFFTTKPPGSGTGLGLNISYGIVVDKHRGDITVESEPGRTVFRVTLPTSVST